MRIESGSSNAVETFIFKSENTIFLHPALSNFTVALYYLALCYAALSHFWKSGPGDEEKVIRRLNSII